MSVDNIFTIAMHQFQSGFNCNLVISIGLSNYKNAKFMSFAFMHFPGS